MNARDLRPLGAALLLAGTAALLLQSGVFGVLPALVWVALMFAAAAWVWLRGGRFLDRRLRIGALALLGVLATATSGAFAGTAALGFVAAAFALVYLNGRRRGWALIPAGLLASLALLVALETLFPRWNAAPVLFLGLAATFTLLYLLPRERGGGRWALYPAIGCIVLTVLVNDPHGDTPDWLLPLLLIGGGSALLWWWRRDGRS